MAKFWILSTFFSTIGLFLGFWPGIAIIIVCIILYPKAKAKHEKQQELYKRIDDLEKEATFWKNNSKPTTENQSNTQA